MLSVVATLLLATIPHSGAIVDTVDLIEVSEFYDGMARYVFTQVLFYEWDETTSEHQLVTWRMLKTPAQIPRFDHKTGKYVARWHDSRDGYCLRQVTADYVRKTRTQFDPELIERTKLAERKRRELTKPKIISDTHLKF